MRTKLSATGWPTAFRPITRTMPSFVLVSTQYQWPLSSAACGEGGPASSCAHSDMGSSSYRVSMSACAAIANRARRSEEHTSELQSRLHLVCRLLLEKKKKTHITSADNYTI